MPRGWMTAADLHAWRQRYDEAEARPTALTLGGAEWPRCYSSDMARAAVTARAIYAGEIVPTPLLREADLAQFHTGRLLLPVAIWRWVLRFAWMTGHRSQRAARDDFKGRVKAVADLAEAGQGDILLVSHAGMMAYLRAELVRRGFRGPEFGIAEHARLYVFER
jgi:broad specificity phosphatase PhoE